MDDNFSDMVEIFTIIVMHTLQGNPYEYVGTWYVPTFRDAPSLWITDSLRCMHY